MYRKIQVLGFLAKYVRKGIDWTEELVTDLGADDIKNPYNSLWDTKSHINPPEFREAELQLCGYSVYFNLD